MQNALQCSYPFTDGESEPEPRGMVWWRSGGNSWPQKLLLSHPWKHWPLLLFYTIWPGKSKGWWDKGDWREWVTQEFSPDCTAKEVQEKGLELPPRKHKIAQRVTHSTRKRKMTSEIFLDIPGLPLQPQKKESIQGNPCVRRSVVTNWPELITGIEKV